MEAKYSHVIFDLDGTLADSEPGIVNAVQYALKELKVIGISDIVIKEHIGIPLQDYFGVLNQYAKSTFDINEAVKLFRVYYKEKGVFECQIFEGIVKLLENLYSNSLLYVATAKYIVFAEQVLKEADMFKYFKDVVGADYGGKRAQKTDLVTDIMKSNKIPAGSKTVMIGDKHMDVDAGHHNKIQTIAVQYGFGSDEELKSSQPHHMAKTVEALSRLLL